MSLGSSSHDQPLPYVDLVFPLVGNVFIRDNAWLLQQALLETFPWLNQDEKYGIHAIKLSHGSHQALLSQRSRLLMRVDRLRATQLATSFESTLSVGGCEITLQCPHIREMTTHTTLYAPYVVNPFHTDEVKFMAYVQQQLLDKDIRVDAICGKHHQLACASDTLEVYSLMLHGLSPHQAATMLMDGLGQHRLMGCGLFVAHKSASAVFN
jgi:CRISPR-associated protein Cas6